MIRLPKRLGPTDAEVAAAKSVLLRRKEATTEREAGARVQCASYGVSRYSPISEPCGKWFPIAEAVYVDANHWVPPYGCSGGGYWRSGEGQYVCPRCGFLNRTYQRDGITKLREHFARIVTAYEPETCFSNRLDFKDGGYPYPPQVKARLDAQDAEDEARRLTNRAAQLRKTVRAA